MLLFGIGFVFIASVAASVAMIFQKRAHAHPPFFRNIQWWVGITLAACASIVDAVAMHYVRTSILAVLACMSIPINVVVSWWLLSETTTRKQRIYLASAIIGILCAIIAVPREDPTPDDLQQFTSNKNIITLSILAALQMYTWAFDQVREQRNPFVYAVLAGMSGAQFVTYGTASLHTLKMTIALAQMISIWTLAIIALTAHVYLLNVALKVGDAIPVMTTFQCTWCVSNILHGIIIYDDLKDADPTRIILFILGILFALLATIGAQYHRNINIQTKS